MKTKVQKKAYKFGWLIQLVHMQFNDEREAVPQKVTPFFIKFFSLMHAVTSPHTCDVTSLDWD